MLALPTGRSVKIMKRTSSKQKTSPVQRRETSDEMRPHYDFDYSKSRPNRFAARLKEGAVAVVLDPDVATVFHSAEAVNTFLRSAITAMPGIESRRKKRAS